MNGQMNIADQAVSSAEPLFALATGSARAKKRLNLAKRCVQSGEAEQIRLDAKRRGAVPYAILNYRRIVRPEDLPMPVTPDSYVLPDTFEAHLRFISRKCRVLRLGELIELLEANEEIPDRSVIVTIDGGHMDAYLYAFPRLLKYGVPASIFIPTGYIGSGMLHYDDRLAMMLLLFRAAGLPMPWFEFISPAIYKALEHFCPDKQVTPEGISILVRALRQCTRDQRIIALGRLAETTYSIGSLPEFEDFMRWEDVCHLAKAGFDIGSMGRFAWANPTMAESELAADAAAADSELAAAGISSKAPFCFPPETLQTSWLDALEKHGRRWALGDTIFPEPRFQAALPMLLGRVKICEANSLCEELLFCRIWQLELNGAQF